MNPAKTIKNKWWMDVERSADQSVTKRNFRTWTRENRANKQQQQRISGSFMISSTKATYVGTTEIKMNGLTLVHA